MSLFSVTIIVIFSTYCFFESMSVLARNSGFKINALSMGIALQNQVLSLNRFIGFLIAPLVGYYADTVGDTFGIAMIGVTGSFVGACTLIVGYLSWHKISKFFALIGQSFLRRGYSLLSIKKAFGEDVSLYYSEEVHFKRNYFIAQFITTGFAIPAVFAINIIALNYGSYSATILQLSAVISGLGNLLLNFYTYPLLAVVENTEPNEADSCYKSIYMGKILGLAIMAPIVIFISLLV